MRGNLSLSYRLSVSSRVAAAIVGGYAVAMLVSIAISRLMPTSRAESVGTGMLLSFAIYASAVVWVFAARTATRAWTGLLIAMAVAAAVWWFAGALA